MRWMARVTALVCVLGATGCGTSATVRTATRQYEGEILGRTSGDRLLVKEEGVAWSIPRGEITDIDHPGNVQLLIGLSLAALCVPVPVGVNACGWVNGVPISGIVGLLVAIVGGTQWWSSVSAADEPWLGQQRTGPLVLREHGAAPAAPKASVPPPPPSGDTPTVATPGCTEAQKEEMRRYRVGESAIERACQ